MPGDVRQVPVGWGMKIIDRVRAMLSKDAEWAEYRECETKCNSWLDDELARIESLPIRGAADELARRDMVNEAHYQQHITLFMMRHNLGLM